jgi:hypothetical protein
MNPNEIREIASKQELRTIRHNYTEEELIALKETFFENDIQLADEQEELDEVKEQFKERMKPLKEKTKDLRKKIRNKFEDKDMEVYVVPNYDNGRMEYYSVEVGDLVEDRKLRPDEKQGRMKLKAAK